VEFTGKDHRALCKGIAGALKGLEPHSSRAWILWGPGGAGKTRTAVEVALALEKEGWLAFSVDFHPSPPEDRLQHFFTQRWPNRPILLSVDYAEQRPADDLRALARAVREAVSKRSAPLALLFLMRANPWEPAAGHVAVALNEAQIRWEDRKVPPMEDLTDRQELFYKARKRFRDGLAPPDAPSEVDYDPKDLPRTPLAILALAVLAAYGHRVVQSQDEATILTDLWEQWEQPRWRRTLEAQGERELLQTPEVWGEAREHIEQALAAASLGRPFMAPEEVAAWWKAHFPFQAQTARGDQLNPHWLAQRLQALFPAAEDRWHLPSISPDPLADVVLARLGANLDRLVASILPTPKEVRADTHWPIRMVVEVLPRLGDAAVPGAPEAAQAALGATARWLEEIVRVLPDEVARDWLQTWKKKLPRPDSTLRLRGFLADFWRAWLNRQLPPEERAWVLNRLGFALSELGKWKEALQATREAVRIYSQLAKQNPQDFLLELAKSLNNLGVDYSNVGWWSKAVQAYKRSVQIYCQLPEQGSDVSLYLARSLNNLAEDALLLGRRQEALRVARESVEIRRRLVKQNREAFLPVLAESLNTLANVLLGLGQLEEALRVARESVEIRRRLVKQYPEAFRPDLAKSLGTYGRALLGLGQASEAREAFEEGLRILLPFVQRIPVTFRKQADELLQDYLRACKEAGKAPDEALVEQARQSIG
jgi:tetratricopeptide (TPR) repeat protein